MTEKTFFNYNIFTSPMSSELVYMSAHIEPKITFPILVKTHYNHGCLIGRFLITCCARVTLFFLSDLFTKKPFNPKYVVWGLFLTEKTKDKFITYFVIFNIFMSCFQSVSNLLCFDFSKFSIVQNILKQFCKYKFFYLL